MTDTEKLAACSTPGEELERQIMSSTVPKNEREWWAMREIERLREARPPDTAMREALEEIARQKTESELRAEGWINEVDGADFQDAYDVMIKTARAALATASPPVGMARVWEAWVTLDADGCFSTCALHNPAKYSSFKTVEKHGWRSIPVVITELVPPTKPDGDVK